jgi:CelD/BcsL family acetyltransferase involved in cellulose biosynthesis
VLTARVRTSWEDVAALGTVWNGLLSRSASDTVFLTWEWVDSWWSAYGQGLRPSVVTFEKDGELVGIAPLCRRPVSRLLALRHETVGFVGDGSADSDYLDCIVARGEEDAVAECLAETLGSVFTRRDLARLHEMPASSPNLGPLARALQGRGWSWRAQPVPCAELRLPGTWEEYLRTLKPRMRTKVRSLERRLEDTHRVGFEPCAVLEALPETLDSLFSLHQRRWARDGRTGVFASQAKRRFYAELAPRFLERGWLRLSTLEVDGRRVAHQMCFEYHRVLYLLQEGYDPDWDEQGIGNVLRSRVLRDAIARGVGTYDFLGGMTEHKRSWGATLKESVRVVAAPMGTPVWLYVDVPGIWDRGVAKLHAWGTGRGGRARSRVKESRPAAAGARIEDAG